MALMLADYITSFLRRRGKIIVLTFFTYAALC
jgi:hypothetical protein